MIADTTFFGGAHGQAISSTYYLSMLARFYRLRSTTGTIQVVLPDPMDEWRNLGLGSPLFYVWNSSNPTNKLQIVHHDGSTVLATVDEDYVATIRLSHIGNTTFDRTFGADVDTDVYEWSVTTQPRRT